MPKIIPKNKRTKFRKFLDKNNITIADLAQKTDIPAQTIYPYAMNYSVPSHKNLVKILAVLKCKYEDIF